VKVTVMADELPGLFEALSGVKNPRNRAARMKDLAVKGLLIEGAGSAVPVAAAQRPTEEPAVRIPSNMPEGFSVAEFIHSFEADT
jgi:hypothetical protein